MSKQLEDAFNAGWFACHEAWGLNKHGSPKRPERGALEKARDKFLHPPKQPAPIFCAVCLAPVLYDPVKGIICACSKDRE